MATIYKTQMIKITPALARDIVMSFDDNLNYWINESGCPMSYAREIKTGIRLLKLIGCTQLADDYKEQFKEAKEYERRR